MKNFKHVLNFELGNYFKAKAFIVSTIIICLICAGLMFIPRIKDAFKSGGSSDGDGNGDDNKTIAAIYDEGKIIDDISPLEEYFPSVEFELYDTEAKLKENVENQTVKFGFVVHDADSFTYYVYNKSMSDDKQYIFSKYLAQVRREEFCRVNNISIEELSKLDDDTILFDQEVLGKDSESNYWYCYLLVVVIFMLIIMYGTSIASSVTNEKSNRSIEILITSTSSTSILFGKVIAAFIALIFQSGLIGISIFGSYQFNKEYFGGVVATMLDIPGDVLFVYAIFGIGGFLFYAFLYGALGALVSKIEDLNKSAGTAQMTITLVYVFVLANLTHIDSTLIKVLSFLPISSYSAMFARVAMGNVAAWEVIVSAVILYASDIAMGILGAKIFRNSTLRYGNPIKLTAAFKNLKKAE